MAAEMLKFYTEVGKLKSLDRQGWVIKQIPRPETVAGHMHRMAVMAMTMDKVHTAGLDMNKVIQMCILHDVAECIVGDITPHDNVPEDEKHRRELEAMQSLAQLLPTSSSKLILDLFTEYEDRQSAESKLTKELDVLDFLLQAFEYEKSEHERTEICPNFDNLFRSELTSKIKNAGLKAVLDNMLEQRQKYKASIEPKNGFFSKSSIENKAISDSKGSCNALVNGNSSKI